MEAVSRPPCIGYSLARPSHPPLSVLLRNGHSGEWWNVADNTRARRKWRSRDKELITLSCCHTACHAPTGIDILVRVRSRVTIRECLEESNDLVLFLIRQTEIADRHVLIVFDLRHRPAIDLFRCSCWAMP